MSESGALVFILEAIAIMFTYFREPVSPSAYEIHDSVSRLLDPQGLMASVRHMKVRFAVSTVRNVTLKF